MQPLMVSEKYLQNTPDQLRKGCGGLSPVPPSKGREIMAVLKETGRGPPTLQWATYHLWVWSGKGK